MIPNSTLTTQLQVLEQILELIPHSVFWKDVNSVYLGCNARFLRDAGLTSKTQVIGKTDFDMPWGKAEAESYRAYDHSLMTKRKSILNLEETQVQADGSIAQVVTSKVPIIDPTGEVVGILGIYMDITEIKTAREALAAQSDKIHSYSKMAALGKMAAGIAHEINTPLAAISASAELASFQLETLEIQDATISEALATIVTTTDHIAKIIRSLKAIAKNEAGEPMTRHEFGPILRRSLELCQERIRRCGIRLSVSETSSLEILCRETEVSQVLINMLNNACDAIAGSKEGWIRVDVTSDSEALHIAFTDSGLGIPKHIVERMFDNFYTTKANSGGTGIGLSISKEIIDRHNGRLIYSPDGQNTRFLISLPLATFVEFPATA